MYGGLRNANDGNAFETIIHDLENSGQCGYNLTAHLYRFEEYGLPQSRHRIIIVGIRKDLERRFYVPIPSTPDRNNQLTCRQAIEEPPISSDTANNERTKQSKKVEERLMCLPPGENAWFLDKVLKKSNEELKKIMLSIPTFKKQFPEATTSSEIRDIINRVRLNVNSARTSHIYRRLNPDKPSYTITGSGGGGTHVYHWEEPRALTNRERARLQTFDDSFVFVGGKESVRKQIGMAVPVEAARQIFMAILKTMAGQDYPSVKHNMYQTGAGSLEVSTALEYTE